MVARTLIVAALLLWLGVGASLLVRGSGTAKDQEASSTVGNSEETDTAIEATGSEAAAANLAGLPFRSVTIQLQRVDWIDRYEKSIDEIAAIGADTVMFVVDPRQEHGGSRHIYLDMRITPTPDKLERLIKHAKAKGLRVILMPIVLLEAPRNQREWRGTIAPDSAPESGDEWAMWFRSYIDMITHYAWIAQGNGVDLLVVGSELVSTESHVDEWKKVIAAVRKIYKGKLTYSANWDHYTSIQFWDKLDLIGMNSYWSLDEGKKEKASVEDIKHAWRDIQKNVFPFASSKGKPLVFLEAGWCSLANAADAPWDYTQTNEDADPSLQKRLYQGFFESWYGHPQLRGLSIWEWTASPEPGDPDFDRNTEDWRRSYTPEGKPAEKVLRDYFSRGRWSVNPKAGR